MDIDRYLGSWGRPAVVAALAALGVLAAVPVDHAAASDCSLGSYKDWSAGCIIDTDGDGVDDWSVADTDHDGVIDTAYSDSDNDGQVDTFYILEGGPNGTIVVRYDHDGDGLYDDVEVGFYGTDPYNPDSDGDGYTDQAEVVRESQPLNPWCTPLQCY
jgi:hypothetical protein